MSELEQAYQKGYEQCKKDFASNPMMIFELLPDLRDNAVNLMQKHKEEISEKHKEMLEKALSGKVSHADLLKFIEEQNKK